MGLFDKIKGALNTITGGGATVSVQALTPAQVGTPVKIKVTAVIKDATLNAENIYLEFRSKEHVSLRTRLEGKDHHVNEERVGHTGKVQVSGPQTLEGKKSYEWETEINIPSNVSGTFHGSLGHHVWEVKAGLDVKGNDPDSGWVEIQVKN